MRAVLLTVAVAALAACSHGDKAGNNSSTAAAGQTEGEPDNLSDDPSNTLVPVKLPPPRAVTAVPAAFRGRWAAVPDDCTQGGAGLLVIDAATLGIGGATLTAGSLSATGDDRLTFDGSPGPGSAGKQTERLSLIDGGRTLVRQQQAPAAAVPYQRCPA